MVGSAAREPCEGRRGVRNRFWPFDADLGVGRAHVEGRAPGERKGRVHTPVEEGMDDEGSWAPSHEVGHYPCYSLSAVLRLVVGSRGYGKPRCQVCHSHPTSSAFSSVGLYWQCLAAEHWEAWSMSDHGSAEASSHLGLLGDWAEAGKVARSADSGLATPYVRLGYLVEADGQTMGLAPVPVGYYAEWIGGWSSLWHLSLSVALGLLWTFLAGTPMRDR